MTEDKLKTLQKEVSSSKRIALDCASPLHDPFEDRLLNDYCERLELEIFELAQQTASACEKWSEVDARNKAASA